MPAMYTLWSAQAYFAKWGDEGVVDLQEKLSELVILTASRTLMGAAASCDRDPSLLLFFAKQSSLQHDGHLLGWRRKAD